ncbi:hypothetical protein K493DRAFT_355787 [Basidiobolus meristosporus CBS 931.73]|uniref:EF-hand domain-containing protein n=1 Tax=Basidiobolus meristosporus CBS 931.73 TaxID=1314790 RepID=A0A1Y1XZY6_9FUNG|nr:hypothetical protein K493DRAFT_355787 [Basidiobolus meristosporus CBS 931.73]|eukprot:ORX91278.1 hypothetical protein K493DRAFT_355787 [Basidiobolus meristosporus CBS 931.73]
MLKKEENVSNETDTHVQILQSDVEHVKSDHLTDDEDGQFDWDSASEEESYEHRKSTPTTPVSLFKSTVRLSILLLLGDVILLAPALGIRFSSRQQAYGTTMNVFFWLACVWTFSVTIVQFVRVIPLIVVRIIKGLKPKKQESFKTKLEHFNVVKRYFYFMWIMAFSAGSYFIFFPAPHDSQMNFFRVLLCFLVAAGLLFIEKLIVHLIAYRFHRRAYKDRMAEVKYALKVLDHLRGARRNHHRHLVPNTQEKDGGARQAKAPGTDPRDYTEVDTDINSQNRARKLAKKLFDSLQNQRQFLIMEDFLPYFSTTKDAERAFMLFDKDGNGDISKREMKDMVIYIYKERKSLMIGVRDMSQAVGKLDRIFLVFAAIILFIACCMLFNNGVVKTLVPLGSMFLALTFVFGSTAASLFKSIIFVFVTHPYDAGDRVFVDGNNLKVYKVGLLSTIFVKSDGQMIYAPNEVMCTKFIHNIRRSSNQSETIELEIDFYTPKAKIVELESRINAFLQANSRDYIPGIKVHIAEMTRTNLMKLYFFMEYKGNWQDGGRRWERRTRFMFALQENIIEVGIKYYLPPQPVQIQPALGSRSSPWDAGFDTAPR